MRQNTFFFVALVIAAMLVVSGAEAHGRHNDWHRHLQGRHTYHRSHRASVAAERTSASAGVPTGQSGGLASWYRAPGGGLTAAHRFFPFGTRVLVTNRSNGRSVVVRINDRGPFIAGRVIDLSRQSAQAIGVTGVSPVVIRRL